jgi:type II secretory pathway pseudopilin PulG
MYKNKGFTIVEAIIVTAVLAAVTVMAFPNFVQFFQMQEKTMEQNALDEIKAALESYAEENRSLPTNVSWVSDLAPYASLSESSIEFDQWEQPRFYRSISDTITYRSASIVIDYAVVYGHGVDRGLGNTGVDVDLSASLTTVASYATLQPELDDYLVKFTNYKQQIKNYETTEQRLKDISSALASYATTLFNEAVVAGTPNAEQFIYYPPTDDTDLGVGDTANYSTFVTGDLDTIAGSANYVINADPADDTQRQADMQILMRFLGLPDNYCCSALDINETPFFYYSNPRPRQGVNCGVRPTSTDRKLPPRVRVTEDDCG